jgi:hypothetical protein
LSEIEIKNNFLENDFFLQIKNFLTSENFPWYFNYQKTTESDGILNFQFTHIFYINEKINSDFYFVVNPILNSLKYEKILKIKANLTTVTEKKHIYDFHVDNKIKNSKTSVYYINTNNGETIFQNKKVIKSIENRLITFPSYLEHAGTSCTDKKIRVVLNINYI